MGEKSEITGYFVFQIMDSALQYQMSAWKSQKTQSMTAVIWEVAGMAMLDVFNQRVTRKVRIQFSYFNVTTIEISSALS